MQGYTAPTRQHDVDHTDQDYSYLYSLKDLDTYLPCLADLDPTDQEYIYIYQSVKDLYHTDQESIYLP